MAVTAQYDRCVNLYGQEAEAQLLANVLPLLDRRSVVDVGAERGSLVETLLSAGADEIHAFEPEPHNVEFLRSRFTDERVTVHQLAVSSENGQLTLRRSIDPESGDEISFGHTVLERPDTDEIAWGDSLLVESASLGSLVAMHEIPGRIGILKIDTEGHDLAVIAGMGSLDCDVLVVEYWLDLPRSLGPCPWTIDDLTGRVRSRGFEHFAFVGHHGELTLLQWDAARMRPGAMGNVLFFHDRVLTRVLPAVLDCASRLAAAAVEILDASADVASERQLVIDELSREVATQTDVAADRLAIIEELKREVAVQRKAAAERLAVIETLSRELRNPVEPRAEPA